MEKGMIYIPPIYYKDTYVKTLKKDGYILIEREYSKYPKKGFKKTGGYYVGKYPTYREAIHDSEEQKKALFIEELMQRSQNEKDK